MPVQRPSWSLSGPLWALLAVLPACAGKAQQAEDDVYVAIQHGNYAMALDRAQRRAEANPGDARAQALYRDAQVSYLLDQGREEVFHGDLTRGLGFFERALEVAPANATVQVWIQKTRAQLATHWLDQAAELKGPEQLADAREAYEKVLAYDPDNVDAKRGLAHVLLLENYRSGLSKTYFDDGMTSFERLLLQQAHRSFQISRRYQENESAAARGEQVESMMAAERLDSARGLEADGLYFAARNEYRLVLLIEPDNTEARAGLDRMDRETRATRVLAQADMEIRRGELGDATQNLEQAEILTESQEDHVSLLKNDIEERRLDEMYQEAQSLYRDYRYPEAVQAYDRLLAVAPDYKDASQRKATIEEFIQLAEEFYAKALAAKDDDEAEEYLRAIHPIVWPEYKDVVQRLEAIAARRAEQDKASGTPRGGKKKKEEAAADGDR